MTWCLDAESQEPVHTAGSVPPLMELPCRHDPGPVIRTRISVHLHGSDAAAQLVIIASDP